MMLALGIALVVVVGALIVIVGLGQLVNWKDALAGWPVFGAVVAVALICFGSGMVGSVVGSVVGVERATSSSSSPVRDDESSPPDVPIKAHQSRAGLAEKRAVAAKAAGDCTLYGSGCLTDWAAMQHGVDGDTSTAEVLMVGDSIVNRCRLYLRARLVPYGLTIAFDYWSSRPTADIPAVSAAAGAVTRTLSYSRIYQPNSFKAIVMGTGTNDIFDPSTMTANIARMKVVDSPVLWGNVYASRSTSYSADLRNAGWVNNQIQASGFPTVDWFGFLASYPGYRIPAYIADGIHPTYVTLPPNQPTLGDGSGCDAWAAIYAPRIAAVAS